MPSLRGFKTGCRLSPRHVLLAAHPHRVLFAPPPQFALLPKQLSMWGNGQYGDCVSAEEAFAKACYSPEIFISDQEVIDWARKGGFLNGADLATVLDAMAESGFEQNGQAYDDGGKVGVDYSNETTLQSAISANGPVKIAIDHTALPNDAGPPNGWRAIGSGQQFANTDHCVSLCGYGPTAWLYERLGLPLPAGLPAAGYLLFTWSSIGFVDYPWIMATCAEAWARNPTTVIGGTRPSPSPTPSPSPLAAIREQVDALFASEEEGMGLRPRVRSVLASLRQKIDALMSSGLPSGQKHSAFGAHKPTSRTH